MDEAGSRRRTAALALLSALVAIAVLALLAWPRSSAEPPGPPMAVELDGTSLSWLPPAGNGPVDSYAVTYRAVGAQPVSVYARGSSATRIDLAGPMQADCARANPDWDCALTGGALEPGRAYEIAVFARVGDSLGALSAPLVWSAP